MPDPTRRFLIRLRTNVGTLEERSPFAPALGAMCFAPGFPGFATDPQWRKKLAPVEGARMSPYYHDRIRRTSIALATQR